MNDDFEKTAVLFAGQGSQTPGMGRDLAESDPAAMELWKAAEKASGLNLRGIFWEGSEAEMSDTRALQPALTVFALNVWRSRDFSPQAVAGHSLGEFAAAAAASALGFEETLRLVSLRGRLMAEATGGAMAAILKAPAATAEEIAKEAGRAGLIVCANYNAPSQTVLSGAPEAVEEAMRLARERKARAVRLAVSGAFHSPLMEEANREFMPYLRRADWRKPNFPVYCNVTGAPCASGEEIRDNLEKQMISPVLWTSVIKNMQTAGVSRFVEIAPKATLGKLAVQIAGEECRAELA